MAKLRFVTEAEQVKENNAFTTRSMPRMSLSQQELSAVTVISFDSYGNIKDEEKDTISRKSHSFDLSETASIDRINQNKSNIKKKCRVIERLKRRQEHRQDTDTMNDTTDSDSLSENGGCKLLKRIKEENQNKNQRLTSSASSVASSITGSSYAGSIFSTSSSHRRRNREALQTRQTQMLSMAEFAGFSQTPSSKKRNTKKQLADKKQSNGWFRRKPKRNNKVGDYSITIVPVGSNAEASSLSSKKVSNEVLISILRNGINDSAPPQQPSTNNNSVTFVEGTVFQDPLQKCRKKVPRIRGGKTSYNQKKQKQKTKNQQNMALVVDNDGYCNAMAPFVQAMVTWSIPRR